MISLVFTGVFFFALGGFLGRWSKSNSSTAKAADAGATQVVADVAKAVEDVKKL